MTDSATIKTYHGDDPYVFFSYAHKDSQIVIPVIRELDKRNCRLWYDAGIEVGSNWPQVVASHLKDSELVVFFISRNFIASQNCRREVNYAVAEKKRMFCVFIEDVLLNEDMAMQLSTVEKVYDTDADTRKMAEEIGSVTGPSFIGDGISGYEDNEKQKTGKNIWRTISIISASLFLILAALVFAYFNGWLSSAGIESGTVQDDSGELEVTEFKDGVSRAILLKAYDGTSLYLCGDYMVSKADAIRYRNGSFYIGEMKAERSSFSDLSSIVSKEKIAYLSLVNQGISDLSPLAQMKQLVYLDISGNAVDDLSFLSDLRDLEVLKIIGIRADLSMIGDLKKLKYLYVDEEGYDEAADAVDTGLVDIVVKR